MNVESNLGELEQIVEALDQKHDALSAGVQATLVRQKDGKIPPWAQAFFEDVACKGLSGCLAMATLFPVRSIECEENLEILARRLATGLGHAHEPEMEAARADREKQVARRKKRRLRRQSPRKPSCPQSFANNYARRVGQASTRPNCYLVSGNGGKGSLTSRAQSRLIHRIRCLPNDYSRNSL
jgi:hypothetical protein